VRDSTSLGPLLLGLGRGQPAVEGFCFGLSRNGNGKGERASDYPLGRRKGRDSKEERVGQDTRFVIWIWGNLSLGGGKEEGGLKKKGGIGGVTTKILSSAGFGGGGRWGGLDGLGGKILIVPKSKSCRQSPE